jgi:hypothetical protein
MLASASPDGNRFNISKTAIDSISYYYQSTFAPVLSEYNLSSSKKRWLNGYYMNPSKIQYEPTIMQALFASQDLNTAFTMLATSMSNAIRTGSDETFNGVSNIVTGTKGQSIKITFYRVVWPWISLHCFIVVAGVVFFMLAVRGHNRHSLATALWKSSTLAVLNRGQEVAGILSGMHTMQQMEAIGEDVPGDAVRQRDRRFIAGAP